MTIDHLPVTKESLNWVIKDEALYDASGCNRTPKKLYIKVSQSPFYKIPKTVGVGILCKTMVEMLPKYYFE